MLRAIAFLMALALVASLPASAARRSSNAWPPAHCQPAGSYRGSDYALCFRPNRNEHGTFVVRKGRKVVKLDVGHPGPTPTASDAGRVGHWAWAALSPDGQWFVAEWSAECEVPIDFFVRPGATPRPVTGEPDWAKSPESTVAGWTTDGRAIVRVRKTSCGAAGKPGLYLVSPSGARTRIGGLELDPYRSLKSRPASSLLN